MVAAEGVRYTAPMFVGIDFGTTNSALAVASEGGDVRLVGYEARGQRFDTFRSVLYFDADERGPDRRPLCTGGMEGIWAYLEGDGEGRFVQSIKSHLASRSFSSTNILGIRYTLEDLVALVVGQLKERAAREAGPLPERVVAGRPVHFVNDEDDTEGDALAEARLREAFGRAGFREVVFALEPVAAAYRYESRLSADEVVLVADFGGGTTDLCLVEIGPSHRARKERRVLGVGGVGLAGDRLDQRVLHHAVAPRLGLGSTYEVIGGEADVPLWLYTHLSRWHLLSFLKSPKTLALLDTIEATANDRDAISAFRALIEEDLGYPLHRAVERAKIALSSSDEALLSFAEARVERALLRGDFDAWIAPDVQAIASAVDQLLSSTGIEPARVDRVFMTGGTSLVPAVRSAFAERFGADKLLGGEELTSVAQGLALVARDVFGG